MKSQKSPFWMAKYFFSYLLIEMGAANSLNLLAASCTSVFTPLSPSILTIVLFQVLCGYRFFGDGLVVKMSSDDV